MVKSILILILAAFLISLTQESIFDKYYAEAYKVAEAMSLEQKIGQTIQVDFYALNNGDMKPDPNHAIKYELGSILIGGNGAPDANGDLADIPWDDPGAISVYANASMEKWQRLASKF